MIRLGERIRLTRTEVERFVQITNIVPEPIHTLGELVGYVDRCKRHYWGESEQTRFLHWLIDREYRRCVGMERLSDGKTPLDVDVHPASRGIEVKGSGGSVQWDS